MPDATIELGMSQAVRPMLRPHHPTSSAVIINFLDGGTVISYQKAEKREIPPFPMPTGLGAEGTGYMLGLAMVQSILDPEKEAWKDEDEEDERIEKLIDRMQRLQNRIVEKMQTAEAPREHWVLLSKSIVCRHGDEILAALEKAKTASEEIKRLQEKGEYLSPEPVGSFVGAA